MRDRRKRLVAGLLVLCMLFTTVPGSMWNLIVPGETGIYAQESETDIAAEGSGAVSVPADETDMQTEAVTPDGEASDGQAEKAMLLAMADEAAQGTLQEQINAIDALRTSAQPTDVMSGTITLDPAYDNGSGLYTENLVIPEYTDITIDLNGCTLTPAVPTEDQFYLQSHITVYGSLTIKDSSAAEGGEASGSQNGSGKLSGGGINLPLQRTMRPRV